MMATKKGNPRLQVGSASWVREEQAFALQFTKAEAEEFAFSARNEVDWLNEHMAEVFSKNPVNVAEIFKTPGKLRGKTPRTTRRLDPLEARPPLSNVFSATPKNAPSPFPQANHERPFSTFQVAEDKPKVVGQQSGQQVIQQNTYDSGYFGSQFTTTRAVQSNEPLQDQTTPKASTTAEAAPVEDAAKVDELPKSTAIKGEPLPAEDGHAQENIQSQLPPDDPMDIETEVAPNNESPTHTNSPYPGKLSPLSSVKPSPVKIPEVIAKSSDKDVQNDKPSDDAPSPSSDGSSPFRPIVRKSSFNFASLPAREPITTKKSLGSRVSQTSNLDSTSLFGRQTGGKSLGNKQEMDLDEEIYIDGLDAPPAIQDDPDLRLTLIHNKTSTQRLQDQISKLGQSQTLSRPPTKSLTNISAPSQPPVNTVPQAENLRSASPHQTAPGAFPSDEDDSWIGPPTVAGDKSAVSSSKLQLQVDHTTTDVMDGIHAKESLGGSQLSVLKRGEDVRQRSPACELPGLETKAISGHSKSTSTSILRSLKKSNDSIYQKVISVSNPHPSLEPDDQIPSPTKTPSRSFKGSPLKAAKDKFSSILKTSKGLFASSAAVSAEAKSATLPLAKIALPKKDPQANENVESSLESLGLGLKTVQAHLDSPSKPKPMEVGASSERGEKRHEAEVKTAKGNEELEKTNDKLERARMKVDEVARVFHLEQERVVATPKEVSDRKEGGGNAKISEVCLPRADRSSPCKTKAQPEAEGIAAAGFKGDASKDLDMQDAPGAMAPPAISRPTTQIGRPGAKRPLKPTKEANAKTIPPTIIRVDTGSQRGHHYHPSNTVLAANLQDSLATLAPPPTVPTQPTLRHKASNSSMSSKVSANNFKTTASRAIEAAARKKEQDELAQQRKREIKAENERQRAAAREEERRQQELQRRREVERQREIQKERERATDLADAKKASARQAIEKRKIELEKAKQMGAPPPAARHHDVSMAQEKALPSIPNRDIGSKAPRLAPTIQRQEETARPASSMLQNTTKMPPKRPLVPDDEHHPRPTLQRNPASYQANDVHTKRRKTSNTFESELAVDDHPKMTAPPIRQSSIRPKEAPTKSLFTSGYTNAPQPPSLQRTTLVSQHNMNQSKPAHPLDMARVSKAPIAFGTGSQATQSHKTPARPGAMLVSKSTAKKASPRYQNGENIDLPEIHTDSEDDEDDDKKDDDKKDEFVTLGWTNSPDLRKALALQETIDPTQVFGHPAPLNMEEVFSKSKDRFKKFRDRTSSANWNGPDRLTDDEVKRDWEARDRVRRQGGWTYDSMV